MTLAGQLDLEHDALRTSMFSMLLIEESHADAESIFELVREGGSAFDVTHVELLGEGLDRLADERFDVVLTDLALGDADRREVLSRIRASAADVAVVVMTGRDDEAEAVQAMAVGAQDYLVKGLMDARLLDHSLRHSIERNRLVVQHARSAHQSEVDRSAAVTASETSDDRRHWLEACAELTQRLFAGDSDRPLDLVLRYALEGTRADLAALTLAVGDEDLRVEAAIGVGAPELIGSIGDRQSSLAGRVVRLGLPVMVDDYRQEPEGAGSLLGSFAVVPLLAGDRAVGTLTVARLAGRPLFSKSDVAQLADYANYAGLALELDHARAEEAHALEAEREESHRLDSLGQLAGGVAHDFNNLLGVILNYTALIALSVTDPGILVDLSEVRAAAERGAALTRQLLTFARRDIANPEPVDVTDIIRSVASMLGRTLGEQVVLELDLSSSPMVVLADRHQLEQILVNLALNARDAMPDGGVLTIVAEPAEPAGEVLLQVRDTGTGMAPDVIARAFEPFFTTKARGHGTGLGLATVHGIVHQNNGEVTIKSVIGQGTAVSVVLPTTKRSATVAAATTLSLGGTERILLVEDEAPLRVATARLLASKGYEVIVAGDGVDALEVLDRDGGKVDVVITDLAMPRMGGDELARLLNVRDATLPVILLSGYHSGEAALNGRVLAKPVSEERLLMALREALDV